MYVPNETLLKVFIISDSGVGKTQLMNQYPLLRNLVNDTRLQLELILRRRNFESMTILWLFKCVTNLLPKSLEILSQPRRSANYFLNRRNHLILKHLQVSEKKALERCASKGNIPYFETSVKEDYNVNAAFLCVVNVALLNEHE
ncbi:hypothetical protein LIER_03325 [Lithospermum erythrorhizon]|uniref:Uncharacterized protein n=1 Tax=Lithospermum erythrorhizon TaxID=34254 RepID=A0AAV3NSQ1_LITER